MVNKYNACIFLIILSVLNTQFLNSPSVQQVNEWLRRTILLNPSYRLFHKRMLFIIPQ